MKTKPQRLKKHGVDEITLTHENLHGCATRWHGFTRAQCQIMGVHWPPPRGWLRDLIGKRIPVEQFERFREARLRCVQARAKTLGRRAEAKARTMNGDNPWLAISFSIKKMCTRCGANRCYLDLDICEACVSAMSGYRDAY
jgi:hypothetical protein